MQNEDSLYIEKAIELLRSQEMEIPEEYVQHISSLGWEHIVLTGDYIWNV
nr:Tn3 family transposase [Bacillus toyonensis]